VHATTLIPFLLIPIFAAIKPAQAAISLHKISVLHALRTWFLMLMEFASVLITITTILLRIHALPVKRDVISVQALSILNAAAAIAA
jgi:hypothetical protein